MKPVELYPKDDQSRLGANYLPTPTPTQFINIQEVHKSITQTIAITGSTWWKLVNVQILRAKQQAEEISFLKLRMKKVWLPEFFKDKRNVHQAIKSRVTTIKIRNRKQFIDMPMPMTSSFIANLLASKRENCLAKQFLKLSIPNLSVRKSAISGFCEPDSYSTRYICSSTAPKPKC